MTNKIKTAFLEIHADENLKKHTFDVVVSKHKKRTPMAYKLVPVMLVLGGLLLGKVYYSPVSFISIDINPSIELAINTFDRVIDVEASNEDAKEIVDSVKLNHLNYITAIEKLDGTESFSEYKDSYTEITVISNSSKDNADMIDRINHCDLNKENLQCYSGEYQTKQDATDNDISFGKYRAYLEWKELDDSITIDDVKELPMREIREQIDALKDAEEFDHSSNVNQHGNCNGKGYGKE